MGRAEIQRYADWRFRSGAAGGAVGPSANNHRQRNDLILETQVVWDDGDKTRLRVMVDVWDPAKRLSARSIVRTTSPERPTVPDVPRSPGMVRAFANGARPPIREAGRRDEDGDRLRRRRRSDEAPAALSRRLRARGGGRAFDYSSPLGRKEPPDLLLVLYAQARAAARSLIDAYAGRPESVERIVKKERPSDSGVGPAPPES